MRIRCALFFSMVVYSSVVYSNPRESVIAVDMDDVFISPSMVSILSYAAYSAIFLLPGFWWRKVTDNYFNENLALIFSKGNFVGLAERNLNVDCAYGSITFRLAELARIYGPFRQSLDPLLIAIHTKRFLLDQVIEILKKLKDKGYTIVVATNCDRIGFELKMKALNFDTLYNGKRLFDAVVVAGKSDFIKLTTLGNKRRFSKLKPNIVFDKYITTAPAYKPEKAYYQVLRDVVNKYVADHPALFDTLAPHIVFFDDKKKNVIGANVSDLDIHAYQISKKDQAPSMRIGLESYFGVSFI